MTPALPCWRVVQPPPRRGRHRCRRTARRLRVRRSLGRSPAGAPSHLARWHRPRPPSGLVTSVPSFPAAGFSGLSSSALVQGFPSTVTMNYANGLYLDPAMSMPWTTSGRVSVSLGGGLSWDFMGGVSRIPGNGFYFGPGSRFDNRTFTAVGTGFSFNFGRGGTLSLSGGVSTDTGAPFP